MPWSQMQFFIKTMGCKANLYDSLVLEKQLQEKGAQKALSEDEANFFILNSCTVTHGADHQGFKDLQRIKRKKPQITTLLTGCLAEVSKELKEHQEAIDLVVSDKNQIIDTLTQVSSTNLDQEISTNLTDREIYWGQLPEIGARTRAFLKIQEGCNDFCTYCIIPYARGKSRSVSLEKILEEVRRLIESGLREVVLTGTNIADWGQEYGLCFDDLIEALLEKTSLERLRLSSLDPSEISSRLLDFMSHPRLMPHFHISLQSAHSRVLRAMGRSYRSEDVRKTLTSIYEKNTNIFVGMDLIAGFPGETLEEHEQSLALLSDLPWTRLHVFPYSLRDGTPATKIPGRVHPQEIQRRSQEFISLSKIRSEKLARRYIGQTIENILFEPTQKIGLDWFAVGHAPQYFKVAVKLPNDISLRNQIGSVLIQNIEFQTSQDWILEGVLAK